MEFSAGTLVSNPLHNRYCGERYPRNVFSWYVRNDRSTILAFSQTHQNIDALVHHEFAPPGQSVTGHFYVQIVYSLRVAVRSNRRERKREQLFLHHDNIPSHIACCVAIPCRRTPFPFPPNIALNGFCAVTFVSSLLRKWASKEDV
jgi:hypothetical protein